MAMMHNSDIRYLLLSPVKKSFPFNPLHNLCMQCSNRV